MSLKYFYFIFLCSLLNVTVSKYYVEKEAGYDIIPNSHYWDIRKHQKIYVIVREKALVLAPRAMTILDVGAFESPFIKTFDWIPVKVATDLQSRPEVWTQMRGVTFIVGNFLKMDYGQNQFDLVINNQVIEHLTNDTVRPFVQKILSLGRVCIISTTFEMLHGTIPGHTQDPISMDRFKSWFANPPYPGKFTTEVVTDGIYMTHAITGAKILANYVIGYFVRD